MKITVNKQLVPIKAHYFFFMACLGPILPQINVFGRQLGISPSVMGILLSILPILYFIAKPLIGLMADYFMKARKFIFMSIITVMTVSFACYIFLPHQTSRLKLNVTEINHCDYWTSLHVEKCFNFHFVTCSSPTNVTSFKVIQLNGEDILCHVSTNLTFPEPSILECKTSQDTEAPNCFYKTWIFWAFVFLTYLGTIGFNVGNSISDAICFDVLGEERQTKYGKQRLYGSIGFGLTSLLAGYTVDLNTNNFTPAIIIMLAFALIDLFILKKLKLPKLSSSESITKDVGRLLRNKKIAIFLMFATIAGIFDAFIFYYMFWHIEEVAERTGMKDHIKLIEGMVVAAECVFGEVLFFVISGKIIKKLGYIHCMTFCFSCYALRLFLISLITNPWYLVIIELLMQGCTYALCYTCIVAYASVISPPGTSATIQGLVAGMDDGLGFSIGALFGGFLYQEIGGKQSFQIFSIIALVTCIAHFILRPVSTHEIRNARDMNNDETKTTSKTEELNKNELEEKILTEVN
ncbi:CLUMA_CG011752, isoform A [Clunio marinus]|uniref:CLUMA_CG011752, isoform A n=1 Tax=Clunio marinus TaxID=568069 RepID=A0A1J1IIW4_9DIPT|nr:CLUMA_CG011752, isoform A [Clunio marinus]